MNLFTIRRVDARNRNAQTVISSDEALPNLKIDVPIITYNRQLLRKIKKMQRFAERAHYCQPYDI
jgi:hypothetical protein